MELCERLFLFCFFFCRILWSQIPCKSNNQTLLKPSLSLSPSVVMIHWTRQIREVLNAQEMGEMGDSSGPLEEISFWKSRFADLASISQQLQKPGVCHIEEILRLCNSFYVPQFSKLAKHIQVHLSAYVCVCPRAYGNMRGAT